MAKTIKLPESAVSAFETDVRELAEDPEGHGLDFEETVNYRALNAAVDYGKRTLTLPDDPAIADRLAGAVTDLSNTQDAIAEGEGNPSITERKFARQAAKSLSTVSSKLLYHAEALRTGPRGGQYTVTASGEKHYVGSNHMHDKAQTRGKGPWQR